MSESEFLCGTCKYFSPGCDDSRWHPGESPDCGHPKVWALMSANMKRGCIQRCKHFEAKFAVELNHHEDPPAVKRIKEAAERIEQVLEKLLGPNSLNVIAKYEEGWDVHEFLDNPHVVVDDEFYFHPCQIKEHGIGRILSRPGWSLTQAWQSRATRDEPGDGGYEALGESRRIDDLVLMVAERVMRHRLQRFHEDEFAADMAKHRHEEGVETV